MLLLLRAWPLRSLEHWGQPIERWLKPPAAEWLTGGAAQDPPTVLKMTHHHNEKKKSEAMVKE